MNIGIIGAGKVGIALGHALKAKGFRVAAIASRRQASLDEARRYVGQECVYTLDNLRVFDVADVVAVTTQDRSSRLLKCRPMVGSAVATMVWSSAPRNIVSMMPMTMVRISGCVSALAAVFGAPVLAWALGFSVRSSMGA